MKMSRALNSFFDAHYERLLEYACQHLPSSDDAEDVVQDAVIAFMENGYRDSSKWAQQLFGCLLHKINDYYRARNSSLSSLVFSEEEAREVLGCDVEEAQAPSASNPDEEVAFEEACELAQELARRLPPSQKRAYEAVVVGGLSNKEASVVLGTSRGNVRKALSLAKSSLRQGMEKYT